MMIDKSKIHGPSNVASQRKDGPPTEFSGITDEERHQRVAKAAYLRAASRDFIGGDPMQDWVEAEREVNAAEKQK